VVPALMLFRAYALKSKRKITKFSLDTQSSTGYLPATKFGTEPKASNSIKYYNPNNPSFGLVNLKNWLNAISYPY
jgi:hypothetical protein